WRRQSAACSPAPRRRASRSSPLLKLTDWLEVWSHGEGGHGDGWAVQEQQRRRSNEASCHLRSRQVTWGRQRRVPGVHRAESGGGCPATSSLGQRHVSMEGAMGSSPTACRRPF
uniref:Uncharacterized protein n=1 Tax=Triticum urartu TaxID=4572 RepID=A0A8R7U2P6_TRIUA